jgi:hypothetical protein
MGPEVPLYATTVGGGGGIGPEVPFATAEGGGGGMGPDVPFRYAAPESAGGAGTVNPFSFGKTALADTDAVTTLRKVNVAAINTSTTVSRRKFFLMSLPRFVSPAGRLERAEYRRLISAWKRPKLFRGTAGHYQAVAYIC